MCVRIGRHRLSDNQVQLMMVEIAQARWAHGVEAEEDYEFMPPD